MLPLIGDNGSRITWKSSTEVILNNGTVNRSKEETKVKLTALVTLNDVSRSRRFYLTVKKEELDLLEQLDADKKNTQIGFAPGDDEDSVRENISLISFGSNGCTITWSSSDESAISGGGIV